MPYRHDFRDRPWRHAPPRWSAGMPHKRRALVRGFVLILGMFALLFVLAVALITALLLGPLQQPLSNPAFAVALFCSVPLVFFFLIILLGGWAFRRFATPVADVMAAADAVAAGDLSTRVREDRPGEFGRLAKSFNRMTTELEHAEQQRRNLTADVAHELRTPLHIIQGNLEGIQDGVYAPTPEQIQMILDETHLLTRLVDDLQTLSLVEAGQLPLHHSWFSATELLTGVAASFSGQAAAAEIEILVNDLDSPQDLQLFADADRLDQVLSNLVANALHHTPSGGRITLEARTVQGGTELRVQDTGSGIPPEDLPYIFDRFWRGDRARTRQTGIGSGLGLAIARQLVQAHGGTIRAESESGQGTTFIIELPTPSEESTNLA